MIFIVYLEAVVWADETGWECLVCKWWKYTMQFSQNWRGLNKNQKYEVRMVYTKQKILCCHGSGCVRTQNLTPLFFYNRNPHTFFIFRWKFWDSGFWRRIIKTEWPITRGSKLDFQRVMFCCVRPKSSIILCLITTDPREVINRCIPCTAQAHKNGANSHFTRTPIGIEYCVHLRVVGELN